MTSGLDSPPDDLDSPLFRLAELLGVPQRPRPLWGVLRFVLWALPLAVLTALALLLHGAWQALVFTFVGAAASTQIVGPYGRVVAWIEERLADMRESAYPVRFGLRTLAAFAWGRPLRVGMRSVGARRWQLPLLRWQYRRRYRQWKRFFTLFASRVILPGEALPPAALPRASPRLVPYRIWRRRQARVLRLTARDLIRVDGNIRESRCAELLATQLNLSYRTPRTARRRHRYEWPTDRRV